MLWHADTGRIDITADIKLLGCTLIPASEMIAHQKSGICYCHKRAEAGQTERVIIRDIAPKLLLTGFGKKPGKVVRWRGGVFTYLSH